MPGIAPIAAPISNANYANAETVTVGTALANAARALWVGGAGNVTVTMLGGQSVEFEAVTAGALLPIAISAVTGYSGSGVLIALW